MKNELGLLNVICIVVGLVFIVFAVLNAVLFSADFFTTDSLFVTTVSLILALVFIVNPLLYLKSEGRLPIPFMKRTPRAEAAIAGGGPPLLDARGRAMPPDVKAMLAHMKKTPSGEA